MDGATLLATLTHGTWLADNSVSPRRIALGARQARTFFAAGTPTRIVFRASGVDIFEITAGVGSGDCSFSASIVSPALERIEGLTMTATAALPPNGDYAAANEMRVSLPTGSETNYPLQFGRPFRQGEIATYAQVLIDGTPAPTQCDVKTRHADGSIKFAVISVVLPTLGTTERVLTFQAQASPSTTPVTIASMLADYDFEATIGIGATGGGAFAGSPVSARAMLGALTDGALAAETDAGGPGPRYWTKGPVCTTVLLHDHATKAYDLGSNATKAIRPMFIVQFWPGINRYHVRHIIENADFTRLKDELAMDVSFTTGQTSPSTRLSQSSVNLFGATWKSRAYWGGADIPRANVKHGVAYLAATRVMPNYDASITMDAAALASYASNWAGQSKTLGSWGYWQRAMAATGGRPDLGLMPKWDVVAMYSGEAHMHEIAEAHAEFGGSWAFYFREGDAAKTTFGAVGGIGRVVSKLSRPTVFCFDNNSQLASGTTAVQDRPTIDGTLSSTRDQWAHDHAHTPGMFWWQYLTTGSVFWLEKLQQLAAWSQFLVNPGLSYNTVGNGRASTDLILNGVQPRGYGWQMRNRARAWWASLDGSPEKNLFAQSLTDAAAMRVGIYDIPGAMVGNLVRDAWNTNYLAWYDGTVPTPRPNALGYMDKKGGYTEAQFTSSIGFPPPLDWGGGAMAPWMQFFVAMSLWHSVELGFESIRPLAEFSSRLPLAIINSPEPRHVADYVLVDVKSDGTYYQSTADIYDGFDHNADGATPASMGPNSASGFAAGGTPGTYGVTVEGYGSIAAAAIAMSDTAQGAQAGWSVIQPWHAGSYYYNHDPRYAITRRG